MKKLFSTLAFLALSVSAFAQYFDFSAVCESGQTLYYNILSNDNHEVAVTFPNNNPIGWYGFTEPEGHLIIPETVEYEGINYTVAIIGQNGFDGCHGITSVVLPNTIKRIEAEGFWYCTGISSEVIIPDPCTFIGGYAFFGCSAMSSLTIGASVDTIQYSAFEDCTGLQSIYCNTPTPPYSEHIPSNPYYEDRSIFNNVPTNIPVYVNCVTFDQFLMNWDWSRFINLEGVFLGAPNLTVEVNHPEYGTAEVISIPEDCDHPNATVRAIANQGHSFCYWKKDDAVVSYEPEYTFTLVHDCALTACFDSYVIVNSTAFPDHVVGRNINASGQVTNEFPSDFIYDEDGVLTQFSFPGHVSSQYSFAHFPSRPSSISSYYEGHPVITEHYNFIYNAYDQIEHSRSSYIGVGEEHESDYYYYYNDEMRLIKKEFFTMESPDEAICFQRTFLSYADGNRTIIDSLVNYQYEQVYNSVTTTTHYNPRMLPLTVQKETYNGSGMLQSCTLQTYSYTPHHQTDSVITQTLTNGEWVNSGVANYVYDDLDRVVEYQTGTWVADNNEWNITHKIRYDFDDDEHLLTVSFRKKNADEWVWDVFSGQTLFYESDLFEWQRAFSQYNDYNINQFAISLHYETTETSFPRMSEWYYEIQNDNGSITYQHLEYVADTTINGERPKIIIRSNTQYDKDLITETTHEYILEEGNKVYWWNKDLHEFTLLYDYTAEPGDEWEIKVGTESIMVHVDDVDAFEYDGETYKRLYISDIENIFNGEIVVGFGHMTSFFPERLMTRGKGFRVDGLRCYWVEDALLYHNGEEDCDAIYSELHDVDEDGPSTGSGTFTIYPNPTNGYLVLETQSIASLQTRTYRITNLTGQTILSGYITVENQQIDIKALPAGMYFINVGNVIQKFVVRQ